MPGKILLSTAYLPPIEYFARILNAKEVFIEREENYLKQSYRNRCYVLSANGPHLLTVPVYLGSFHKTAVKDIRIDYSKRWQQVHIGALRAAYSSSPFFLYYFEDIEKVIVTEYKYLIDLNTDLLRVLLRILSIDVKLSYTTDFMPSVNGENDYRYSISPKKESGYIEKKYTQVFSDRNKFVKKLSIVDLIFNTGVDALNYL